MKKRTPKKLKITSETLRRLEAVKGGAPDVACEGDSSGSFSGSPQTYCVGGGTTMLSCESYCP